MIIQCCLMNSNELVMHNVSGIMSEVFRNIQNVFKSDYSCIKYGKISIHNNDTQG